MHKSANGGEGLWYHLGLMAKEVRVFGESRIWSRDVLRGALKSITYYQMLRNVIQYHYVMINY